MRWLLPILSPLLLLGCAPKTAALQAPSPLVTAVVTAASTVHSREVTAAPAALSDALLDTLAARNLQPTVLDAAAYTETFAGQRTTAPRLRHLVDQADGAALLVLCEATPRFDSQLNGRFRWVIDVTLSVAPADDLALASTETFDVPVFLSFHHEREPEALAAAAPLVQRRLGRMLDGLLGGL